MSSSTRPRSLRRRRIARARPLTARHARRRRWLPRRKWGCSPSRTSRRGTRQGSCATRLARCSSARSCRATSTASNCRCPSAASPSTCARTRSRSRLPRAGLALLRELHGLREGLLADLRDHLELHAVVLAQELAPGGVQLHLHGLLLAGGDREVRRAVALRLLLGRDR